MFTLRMEVAHKASDNYFAEDKFFNLRVRCGFSMLKFLLQVDKASSATSAFFSGPGSSHTHERKVKQI